MTQPTVTTARRGRTLRWHPPGANPHTRDGAVLVVTDDRITVNGDLAQIPDGWVQAARRAHAALAADPTADLGWIAGPREGQ